MMTQVQGALVDSPVVRGNCAASARRFGQASLGLAGAAALLAGWWPLQVAVLSVFLFAGPHNWLEIRYFLSRLPARWGKLRGYFLLAGAGIFGLTAAQTLLSWLSGRWHGDGWAGWLAFALWNSLLVLWIAALMHLRSRQNPRRDWFWVWPAAIALLTIAWALPRAWALGLIAMHPLIGLWILDRELRRSRPELRRAYHACLACLPVLLLLLCWRLAARPSLPGEDVLTAQITRQAGAELLPGVSSHLLVAVHGFMEIVHYGVWVLAIPLVGLRTAPWRLQAIPLARRTPAWRKAVGALLAVGVGLVLLLWACFLADYATTWNIYFTVSLLHVLAEFPFLLRAL
jgi:hypothetical protein